MPKQTKKLSKTSGVNKTTKTRVTSSIRAKSKLKKSAPKKEENYFKKQFMLNAGKFLVKTAAIAANAALYNKEVGKRLSKRSREALGVVGQLAQGVKSDITEGVKAARAAKKRKLVSVKTKAVKKKKTSR